MVFYACSFSSFRAVDVIRKFVSYGVVVAGAAFLGVSVSARGAEGVAPPAIYPADSWQGWSKATIRVLDRLESRSVLLTLSVGEEGHYRSLSLKLLACVQRPPTVAPETAARLHLEDSKVTIPTPFEGWILANQPSLSLYQSSLYDVQVVQCDGQKVDPMVGPLPAVNVPQITSVEPERLDADGQTPVSQANGSVSAGGTLVAPTSLLPPEEGQSVNSSGQQLVSPPPVSPNATLPPPTSLLP
ncbi:DUF2155 domain-containing protein [Acetobacteraceae bacterium ESL0709]|nr:DUF2155 domain-containing protein [Acetobacteraceae bacterium ESL0697]MDF7677188.1 DUF2155 domain-containing protein [Acetobacteraceae bacterium ESL0709]